jgi:hypothetical protein
MSHGHAGLIRVTTTLLHDHERVTTPVRKVVGGEDGPLVEAETSKVQSKARSSSSVWWSSQHGQECALAS